MVARGGGGSPLRLTLVEASGGPRALGRAYGEALAQEIREALRFYELEGARNSADGPSASLDAAVRAMPGLVREMEGVAEGAEVPLEDIFFLNRLEEMPALAGSTIITAGRFLMLAKQGRDGSGSIALVSLSPDGGPPITSPTYAGALPAAGMNSAGFAHAGGSFPVPGGGAGVPRGLVARAVLGAGSFDAAVALAQMPARAAGYAHVVASRNRTIVVEATGDSARLFEGQGIRTNHRPDGTSPPEDAASEGSRARLERAKELLMRRTPATPEAAIALLADHGSAPEAICCHSEDAGETSTLFGMVCDLVQGTMLVCAGNPCEAAWHEIAIPGWSGGGLRGPR